MATIIKKHEMSARPKTILKFKSRIIEGKPNECWVWQGVKTPDNYGYMRQANMVNGKEESYIRIFVHRLAYYINYGEITDGLVVDHICHNPIDCQEGINCQHRLCINPSHLKLISFKNNLNRSSNKNSITGKCKNKIHPWIESNIKTWSSGKTVCILCHNETTKRNAKKAGK